MRHTSTTPTGRYATLAELREEWAYPSLTVDTHGHLGQSLDTLLPLRVEMALAASEAPTRSSVTAAYAKLYGQADYFCRAALESVSARAIYDRWHELKGTTP